MRFPVGSSLWGRFPGSGVVKWCMCLFVLFLVVSPQGMAETLEDRYPGLTRGFLKHAKLDSLNPETLLKAGDLVITRSEIDEKVKKQDSSIQRQLEKNLLFLLEQEAARRLLLNEVARSGIVTTGADESRLIQALFEKKTQGLSVSDEACLSFYDANKEMVGESPFEEMKEAIRQFLLQDKRQQAVNAYIEDLSRSADVRVNKDWVAAHSLLAMDNPVDKARNSGKPTMVEFGATGCVPCDMMQPILDSLKKNFTEKLNVVFVHVREEEILASRYGIMSIPVQVFFDAKGKEVFRHTGFFPESEVKKQLTRMGVSS